MTPQYSHRDVKVTFSGNVTKIIPTLETSKITLRKNPDPGSTMREWYNIKSLPHSRQMFRASEHFSKTRENISLFFCYIVDKCSEARNISLKPGKTFPCFFAISEHFSKTRENISRFFCYIGTFV